MKEIKTIPLGEEERKKIEDSWNNNHMLLFLGLKLDLSSEHQVKGVIEPLQSFHRGGLGTEAVNGVIMSGLFDLLTGLVGIVNSNNHRTGTVQLNITFLKPLKGNKLVIIGKLLKSGKSLVFSRSEIYDEQDNLCASCDGICSIDFSSPPVTEFISI